MKQVPNPQRGMALSWMKNLDGSPSAPRRCHQQSDPDSPYFYISISTQGQHVKTKKTDSPLEHVQYITRPPPLGMHLTNPQLRSTYTTPAQPPRSHNFATHVPGEPPSLRAASISAPSCIPKRPKKAHGHAGGHGSIHWFTPTDRPTPSARPSYSVIHKKKSGRKAHHDLQASLSPSK